MPKRTRPRTRQKREEIEARNRADAMVYNVEKMLKEHRDKISGSERGDVENALADAKKALESGEKAAMDKAREGLTTASHKLAEQMYKAAQPQAEPGAGPEAGPAPGAAEEPKKKKKASSTPSTWM